VKDEIGGICSAKKREKKMSTTFKPENLNLVSTHMWENNIQMYVKETEREEVHKFKLAQVRAHLLALENTATVRQTSRNSLTCP
jgi:hypothetical protein